MRQANIKITKRSYKEAGECDSCGTWKDDEGEVKHGYLKVFVVNMRSIQFNVCARCLKALSKELNLAKSIGTIQ